MNLLPSGKNKLPPPICSFRRWESIFHFRATLWIKLWSLAIWCGRDPVCGWPLWAGACHVFLLSNTGICDLFHRQLNFPCGESSALLYWSTQTHAKRWNFLNTSCIRPNMLAQTVTHPAILTEFFRVFWAYAETLIKSNHGHFFPQPIQFDVCC